jgi:O-antigen ligase
MARSVEFSIISTSIFFNYEYYKNKFLDHLVYVVLGIVVFGFVIDPSLFSGRYSGLIWNPNMFSSLVIIAFSIYFLKFEKRTGFDYFILFTLLISSLSSGSRGSLVAIILVFLIKYGLTFKNMIYGFIALGISLLILSINLETSLNRFAENNMFNDRVLQFEYAYLSMQEKLFTGYGLDKYAYIDKSLVPRYLKDKIIGAHNGYLAILAQYGIIFGSVILFLIFRKLFLAYSYFKNKKSFERVYLFIILYVLIASIYESLMTGINDFSTILFWFSLSILSYSMFLKENEN